MVWFQCEDCGDNLKKPKLLNHFRVCSANKLSCIDCGQVFGQQSVQGHTQCITETEKYGPKGQGKISAGTTLKPISDTKQRPEVDINVGLSERPPWFCSLCNTNATSRQTLLLHAEGKKHKAKARAFHASKQPPKQTEEVTPSIDVSTESNLKSQLVGSEHVEESKESRLSEISPMHTGSEVETGSLRSSKKRKPDSASQKTGGDTSGELGNGEVIQVETKCEVKKTKHREDKDDKAVSLSPKDEVEKKIKWKKLISSALKSNPDGVLKMRKVRKLVREALGEYEVLKDESQLIDILERKINSSSKFTVDGKYVRLVTKS